MKRRAFVLAAPLAPAVGLLILLGAAVPLQALAQPAKKIPRIGVLVAGPPPEEHACVIALRCGLADLGYVEGRTHLLEMRWGQGRPEEMFPRFTTDLVGLGVALIVSVASQGLVEAKDAMKGVPVVMAVGLYPVERGLISSLSRPGGNITGLASFSGDLFAKRVQLIAETLPGLSRVAVLHFPSEMGEWILRDMRAAARKFALELHALEVKSAEHFALAFQTASRAGAQAVVTTQSTFFYQHRRLIADLALKHKLPSFSGEPLAAEAGTLMTHGASIPQSCLRAASFVDRILKGAKPSELPAELPTSYELVINLATARALGLALPQAILLRADQVIE